MRLTLFLAVPVFLLGATHPRKPAASAPSPATIAPNVAPGAVLPDVQRNALLAGADFDRLWRHQPQAGTEDVFNGCFGSECQRLEFVFTSVRADAKQLGRYVVAGKFRCYEEVTPFHGSVLLQKVERLPADAVAYRNNRSVAAPTYCASGRFAVQATSKRGLGGQFTGRVALDFQLDASQNPYLAVDTPNPATRWGGLLFEGQWRENAAQEPVHVFWKQGIAVTHQILEQFEMGGRNPTINRRYTRMGWQSMWANDEWWVEGKIAKR